MKRMFFREVAILLVLALLAPMFSVAEGGNVELPDDVSEPEQALGLEGFEAADAVEIEAGETLTLDGLPGELSGGEPEGLDAGAETGANMQFNEAENAAKKYGVPAALTLGVKETFALKCTKKKLTYKTSSAKIAKVDAKGVVTAVKKGKATITVYSNKKKLTTCKVTVVAAPKKVTLDKKSAVLGVKEKLTLMPQVTKNSHTSFTYTVKNKKIATVSKTGVVTGKKAGKTTVTVKTHNGKKATLKLTVKKAPGKVTMSKKTLELEEGQSYTLVATLPKKTASNKLTWTTSNKKVAKVDEKGTVTAVKAGTAKITVATFNNKRAVCTIKVNESSTPTEPESLYMDKVKGISEEGIEDKETLKFIRAINKEIDEINESIPSYNEAVHSIEDDVIALCGVIPVPQMKEDTGKVRIAFGADCLNIDAELLDKLANGAAFEIQETSEADTILTIGDTKCIAYFSGNTLCIDRYSSTNTISAKGAKAKEHSAVTKNQTDSEYESSKRRLKELKVQSFDLVSAFRNMGTDKLSRIEKELETKSSGFKKVVDSLKGAMVDDDNYSKEIRDQFKNKYYTYLERFKNCEALLVLVRSMQTLLKGVEIKGLSDHCTELAARWEESIGIYEEFHLNDPSVLKNSHLKRAAENLDMYIHRLWWNYRIDAVLTVSKMLAASLILSTKLGQLLNVTVENLAALVKSLSKAKAAWITALAEMSLFIHGELYKRNYNYMKEEDGKLHSFLEITVIDEDTDLPLEGVEITYRDGFGDLGARDENGNLGIVQYTDANGFSKFHISPGSWYLFCSLNGLTPVKVDYNDTGDGVLKSYQTIPVIVKMKSEFIRFGHYEQDNDLSNGPELIEWRVLKQDGNTYTMISRYGLDYKPYHTTETDITWENCSLRAWLNGTFLNSAFTSAEQAKLQTVTVKAEDNPYHGTEAGNDTQDKVYLLSISEALDLFSGNSDRICEPTTYCKARFTSYSWWLRSPGLASNFAAIVWDDGAIDGPDDGRSFDQYVTNIYQTVRPVICLQLS